MGSALVGELFAYLFIPAIAVVGIVFALYQWFLVSQIRLSLDRQPSDGRITESLLEHEAEAGVDPKAVATKCCEIQNAISIGMGNLERFRGLVSEEHCRSSCQ